MKNELRHCHSRRKNSTLELRHCHSRRKNGTLGHVRARDSHRCNRPFRWLALRLRTFRNSFADDRRIRQRLRVLTFLILNSSFLIPAAPAAQYRPLPVDENSKLATGSKFVEANNLVSNEVVCVRVDMVKQSSNISMNFGNGSYWTDCELKVLDKDGYCIYFASTVWRDRSYHADDGTIDPNAKIYYYRSGANPDTGVCAYPKKRHIPSGNASYTSGNSIQSDLKITESTGSSSYHSNISISAVEFYPNLSGSLTVYFPNGSRKTLSIREIFLNPENSVIVSRKSKYYIERVCTSSASNTGERIWRPVIPQYYRTIPTKE